MGHSHHHDHHHDHHHHAHSANKKALFISFLFIATFMIVEVIGGFLSHSLTLLSDAGHMFSDALSLGLSLVAVVYGAKGASIEKTYGYKRFEILAALFNGVALLVISLYILIEAFLRFYHPENVAGVDMLVIACIGLLVNIFVAWILMKGDSSENLNIKSALVHVIGDLLGSVGAIVAGLLIILFNWGYADPIASIIVSILILKSGWQITNDAIHILMEGKPKDIHLDEVKNHLINIPGVSALHDLHVWTITSGFPALSCHLVVENNADRDKVLMDANHILTEHFSVKHATIQIEGQDFNNCSNEQQHQ